MRIQQQPRCNAAALRAAEPLTEGDESSPCAGRPSHHSRNRNLQTPTDGSRCLLRWRAHGQCHKPLALANFPLARAFYRSILNLSCRCVQMKACRVHRPQASPEAADRSPCFTPEMQRTIHMSCDNGRFFGATCSQCHVGLTEPTRLERSPSGFRVCHVASAATAPRRRRRATTGLSSLLPACRRRRLHLGCDRSERLQLPPNVF